MTSDIAIAQSAKMLRISQVAQRYDIEEEYLEPYGHYKAKISLDFLDTLKDKPDGKLIMVTAINPTPAGEGKTTTTIGLGDALNRIGKKAIICLREPSMGPVFAALPAAVTPKSSRWKTSISISPATSAPLPWRTTCCPP